MINNLSVDLKNSIVRWDNNGVPVSYNCQEVQNAVIFEEKVIVFLLVGNEPAKRKILCLSGDGNLKYNISSPDGWYFSYITKHPTAKITVVCGSNVKVDGWYDWHFAIDPDSGLLTRQCPAY